MSEREDEIIANLAKRLADRLGRADKGRQPMEDLASTAKATVRQDIKSFETTTGAAEDGQDQIFGRTTAGKATTLRMLLRKEQPRTHTPKPYRHQFPEAEIDEAAAKRPALQNIGSLLTPPEESAN